MKGVKGMTRRRTTRPPGAVLIETLAIRNRHKPSRINSFQISNRDILPLFSPHPASLRQAPSCQNLIGPSAIRIRRKLRRINHLDFSNRHKSTPFRFALHQPPVAGQRSCLSLLSIRAAKYKGDSPPGRRGWWLQQSFVDALAGIGFGSGRVAMRRRGPHHRGRCGSGCSGGARPGWRRRRLGLHGRKAGRNFSACGAGEVGDQSVS